MGIENIPRHLHDGNDSPLIPLRNLKLPGDLQNAPLPLVTAPTGGGNIDPEARTAINSIITRLEDLGLILDN